VALVALAAALFGARPAASSNPLGKVIELMDSLTAKITAEGEAEAKAYIEFTSWCDDAARNKKFEIKTATTQKGKLEAAIAKHASDISGSDAKIEELGASIAKDSADLKDATVIREKEAGEFSTNEAELEEAIDTLGRAIAVIEREMAKNPAAFAQMDVSTVDNLVKAMSSLVEAAAFSSADKQKLMALVQREPNTESEGRPGEPSLTCGFFLGPRTAGATVRLYLEKYVSPSGDLGQHQFKVVEPLAAIALELSKLQAIEADEAMLRKIASHLVVPRRPWQVVGSDISDWGVGGVKLSAAIRVGLVRVGAVAGFRELHVKRHGAYASLAKYLVCAMACEKASALSDRGMAIGGPGETRARLDGDYQASSSGAHLLGKHFPNRWMSGHSANDVDETSNMWGDPQNIHGEIESIRLTAKQAWIQQ
ncbi:unnamed protein product, partial [Prorocentrum cordatum]